MVPSKPDCQHESGTHCIHSSERRSFRSCRRRWNWAFREHYTPEVTPKPLEFGIAFHEGMEAIYEPSRWETTTDEEKYAAAEQAFVSTCEAQRDRFLEATRQRTLDKPHGDDYAERIELGKGMLHYYVFTVHPHADRFYRPVAVEVPFSIPLQYPEGIRLPEYADVGDEMVCRNSPVCGQSHPNPAPITLNGRVDALLEDKVNGGYYIIDWKSAASLITDAEFLQLDDQITSYCAALELVLNIDVRGFLYAEIRKDYPKPLEELTRTYKGRRLSTNVNQMTTHALALKTIQEKDPEAYNQGLYDDYLKRLEETPPKFHQRFPVIQGEAKLKNVLKNVAMEAIEMTNPDVLLYPSPTKMNCQGCAYKAPCLGKYNDENYSYTLKTLFGKKEYEPESEP